LELFALTSSLGSTESLVVAPQMMGGRDLTPEQLRVSGVTEGTVRLSIGLEDEEDLVADVAQALDTIRTRCG
jgi:cystathionine beta-lyase/cystathionine gamma-synthase